MFVHGCGYRAGDIEVPVARHRPGSPAIPRTGATGVQDQSTHEDCEEDKTVPHIHSPQAPDDEGDGLGITDPAVPDHGKDLGCGNPDHLDLFVLVLCICMGRGQVPYLEEMDFSVVNPGVV